MQTKNIAMLDEHVVIKKLGKGTNATVKLVQDEKGQYYAAKVIKQNKISTYNFKEMIMKEYVTMLQLQHPNIVKVYKIRDKGIYLKHQTETKVVMYIIMEYCKGGMVFDYLYNTGGFTDEICRFYFKQLAFAIQTMHQAGYAHRDIKPENLLFDEDFNLKITDFGYSIILGGLDGSGWLKTYCGTFQYMAPEIIEHYQYRGDEVDKFSAGVLLFVLKSQNPP